MARARPADRTRSRGPSRRGPTSGRVVLPRSLWRGCSSWPHPWLGRGRLASRCSQGQNPCSASRQPPMAHPPPAATAGLSMLIAWCIGVTLGTIMHPGWQNGRSRSETGMLLNGHNGQALCNAVWHWPSPIVALQLGTDRMPERPSTRRRQGPGRLCPVQPKVARSGLRLRVILRSPDLPCESLPGFGADESLPGSSCPEAREATCDSAVRGGSPGSRMRAGQAVVRSATCRAGLAAGNGLRVRNGHPISDGQPEGRQTSHRRVQRPRSSAQRASSSASTLLRALLR